MSVCLTNCLSLFLSGCIPDSPVILCLFLSLSLYPCPSTSHLLWISQHLSPEGPLPRNYTPFALTQTCWSIYHTYQEASSTYDRIRRLPGGRGGVYVSMRSRTLNTHHTQTAKHLDVSVNSMMLIFLTLSLSRSHTHTPQILQIFRLSWFFSSYWFSTTPLGTVRTLFCLIECISSSAVGLPSSNEF